MSNLNTLIPKPHKARINLLVLAGVAKPNPKMGQSLGPLGINMMQFCKDFNSKTTHIKPDTPLRVQMKAYFDRTFDYVIKPPPTSWFIKKSIGKAKTTNLPGHINIDTISIKNIYEIAQLKQDMDQDLKNIPIESIVNMITGQCRSMGVNVVLERENPPIIKPHQKI